MTTLSKENRGFVPSNSLDLVHTPLTDTQTYSGTNGDRIILSYTVTNRAGVMLSGRVNSHWSTTGDWVGILRRDDYYAATHSTTAHVNDFFVNFGSVITVQGNTDSFLTVANAGNSGKVKLRWAGIFVDSSPIAITAHTTTNNTMYFNPTAQLRVVW